MLTTPVNILVTIASGSKQHDSKACNEVYNEVYPQASSRIRQAKKGSQAAPEVMDKAASKVGGSEANQFIKVYLRFLKFAMRITYRHCYFADDSLTGVVSKITMPCYR